MSFIANTVRCLLVVLAIASSSAAWCELNTVYFVRHAEKAAESGDPELSLAGKRRAEKLAATLKDEPISQIWSTPFRRTVSTARPLATAKGLSIHSELDTDATVQAILAFPAGTRALVVGHSDTVPEMIQRLSGQTVTIDHSEFGHLFILLLDGQTFVQLQHLQY